MARNPGLLAMGMSAYVDFKHCLAAPVLKKTNKNKTIPKLHWTEA